jgi:hypothetical protein
MLKFGHTTKRYDEHAAGYFGEGVKVEINRLSACGAAVTYRTGSHEWLFGYSPSNELWVKFYRLQTPNPFFQVEILHLPSQALPKEEDFLFLQPQHSTLRLVPPSGTDGVSVLLLPHHVGKVYIHGIAVKLSNPDINHLFGIDYSGRRKPADLGMGRDRVHVNNYQMAWHLHLTMASLNRVKGTCPYARFAARGIASTDAVPYPREHTCDVCMCTDFRYRVLNLLMHEEKDSLVTETSKFGEESVEFALHAFDERFGPRAIPMTKSEALEEKDNEKLLKVTFVPMPEKGVQFLRHSKNCPTLESIRAAHALDFLRLPEMVFANDPRVPPYPDEVGPVPACAWPLRRDAQFFEGFREFLVQHSSPHIKEEQLRFKHFSSDASGNIMPIVPITPPKREEPVWYLVDVRFYCDLDLVHETLKKEDEEFNCPGSSCGCTMDLILEDLLKAVRRKHKNIPPPWLDKINRRIRRAGLSKVGPWSSPSLDAAVRLGKPTPSPSPVKPPEEAHGSRSFGSNAAGGSGSTSAGGSPSSRITRVGTGNAHLSSDTDTNFGAAHESMQRAQALANNLIKATAAASDPVASASIVQAARAASQGIKSVCEDVVEEKNLSPTDERICGLPLWVDSSTFKCTDRTGVQVFACLILVLGRRVFGVPDSKMALFWEDKETMAFNRDGQLFFNLRYFEEWAGGGRNPMLTVLSFWYVMFAHELAHNVASNHDRQHEYAMETLIIQFLPKFLSVALSLPSWEALLRIWDN